ncbi:MAG TPA: TetR/AcrR family transcriptional regulator [Vicinamibacterales bacterium]|nr:TetR/AcrR family transcriptional regulator [Vicinamibacterales bacterium]
MSPRSLEQNKELRAAARARLLDAALHVFASHGYSATPVDAIAAEAGVSVGLLYYHFANKRALLQALVAQSLADVGTTFAAADREINSADRLAVLLRSVADIMPRHRRFWSVFYGIRMQPGVLADLGPVVQESAAAIVESLERYLRDLQWPDPAIEARLLFAQIDGMCQHYVLDPQHYPLDRLVERLIARYSKGGRNGVTVS